MGEISDIVSALKDFGGTLRDAVGSITYDVSKVVKPSSRSISAMSLQGTANFAVLMSDSVDFDDALMIGKSLEQRFATFLLTVLTMNPYMSIGKNEAPSAAEYLKQFHQNMGTQYEINSTKALNMLSPANVSEAASSFIIEAADTYGVNYDCWLTESLQIAHAVYNGVSSKGIDIQNTKFNYTIEDVTEQSLLNNKGSRHVSSILEAYAHGKAPTNRNLKWNEKRQVNYLPNNEFKKSNESVPTLLHIRVYPYSKQCERGLEPLDFIVGVKATIHQVPSADVISNIESGLRNGSTFFNFIKWTTGETKFFKDFLLMLDQNKMDASNASSSSGGWWSALRRRKASASIRKFSKGKNILPNATIACTMDDLIALKENYGFDLTGADASLILTLMQKYFLMSFVRVSPALQRVDFLFDGHTQFETASYSTISKESGKDDKKFKEMMKLLGRSA